MRFVEGTLDADGLHIGIASATWNQSITDRLLNGAVERAEQLGAAEITVVKVPGALELPVACRQLVEIGCDAVVAIGAVVKGETDHYDLVAGESARGVAMTAEDTGTPVANAILAVHDFAQAMERAGDGDANKGFEAVDAAVTTATALRALRSD